MPNAPRRPCSRPGCGRLQPCAVHKRHKAVGQTYQDRKQAEPWRALYKTAAWLRARRAYLAEHPLCAECEQAGRTRAADTVDHVRPHRGDLDLFWQVDNWRALCRSCHSRKTAGETWGEGRSIPRGRTA